MTQELPFSPEPNEHSPDAVRSLQQAMRRARADNAERAGIVANLRELRVGRLELLLEALQPLVAQIPDDAEMFDVALLPGVDPRLFIDMIGYVEMGRNARLYRLVQDRRHARVVLVESEDVDVVVAAVTDYVARRLIERERALASDLAQNPEDTTAVDATATAVERLKKRPARAFPEDIATWARGRAGGPAAEDAAPAEAASRPRHRLRRGVAAVFSFFIEVLGAVTFFLMLAFVCWIVWMRLRSGTPVS